MITRADAIEAIYEIINSGIIVDELEGDLRDVASCIKAEAEWGIHAWGMPDDDYILLCTSHRTDLPDYEDFIKKQVAIADKYSFSEGKK